MQNKKVKPDSDMRVKHQRIRVKQGVSLPLASWRKSSKRTVSYKNWFHFFILLSHSFTETDSKKGKFCGKFFEKIEIFRAVS